MNPCLEGDAYIAHMPEKLWAIKGLVPLGGTAMLFGRAKGGKSFLALNISVAIANPETEECLGFPVHVHGPVLYLQLDTAPPTWKHRIKDIRNGTREGMPTTSHPVSIKGIYFLDREMVGEAGFFPLDFRRGDHCDFLKHLCSDIQPVLVVIDTIREVHRGNENDSGDMQRIVANIRAATGKAAIIYITHPRKEQAGGGHQGLIGSGRGSNYLEGQVDTIIRLTSKPKRGTGVLEFEGRSADATKVLLLRQPQGLWAAAPSADMEIAREIVAEKLPYNEMVRELSRRIKKGATTAKTLIREVQEEEGDEDD